MGATGRRILIGTAVLVPLAAIGVGGAYAAGLLRPAAPDYRMVEVARGTVSEVVDLTGSVTRVNQATTTFPTSGTVTWLGVEVGEQVTKGQQLARIEQLPLQVELVKAESELTQARAQYQEDVKAAEDAAKQEQEAKQQQTENPQSAPPSSSSETPSPPKQPKPDQSKVPSNPLPPLPALMKQLEVEMRAAGHKCAPKPQTESPTSSLTETPTPTPTSVEPDTGNPENPAPEEPEPNKPGPDEQEDPQPKTLTPTPTPSMSTTPSMSPSLLPPADVPACLSALRQVTSTQGTVFAALKMGQLTLDAQTKALAEAAEAQAKAMAKAEKQQAEALAQAQAELLAQSTGIEEAGAEDAGPSAGATKAQLAQDLVAITRAEQAVRKARADLDGATLRAPITGVVGQIDFTEHSVASADSGITIVGSGASEVTVRVPLSLMGKVTQGQPAEVVPPGAIKPVQGKVTSVSLLPNASSPGSYDTVISVPRSPVALTSGVSATVRIEVASATDVPLVPMSATVPIDEHQATVQVLGPHGVEERTITTGIKGVSRIEVTKGLTVGQSLVIADPTRPLPSLDIFGNGSEPAPDEEQPR